MFDSVVGWFPININDKNRNKIVESDAAASALLLSLPRREKRNPLSISIRKFPINRTKWYEILYNQNRELRSSS